MVHDSIPIARPSSNRRRRLSLRIFTCQHLQHFITNKCKKLGIRWKRAEIHLPPRTPGPIFIDGRSHAGLRVREDSQNGLPLPRKYRFHFLSCIEAVSPLRVDLDNRPLLPHSKRGKLQACR